MGKGVEKKKKKKGRPSLLDIQKRNLKLQQEQEQQELQNLKTNPNSKTSISPNPPPPQRRFTRRNPNPDGVPASSNGPDEDDEDDDDDDDDEQQGSRRQRKLNHVLRAPPNHRSSVNSPYLDLGLYGSDSNEEDDYNGETPLKKQKINGGVGSAKKGEKHNSSPVWKATEKQHLGHGTTLVSGPTTPLPDKKLLVFILDRLQKKDTYGVYSEPVDPNELPDYHEIIENPMDFGTVRKKLEDGAYNSLEQFEHDVFLISSNAMQYNAPDSIYFRQARTIHELAKKNFENLRRDSDTEQEPKIVRRGRPPKNLKKLLGKSSSEHDGLDATPIKGDDNAAWSNSYNLRKGRLPDKYASVETSKRASYGARNSEGYGWLPEYKFDKSDDFSGSSLKGSMKYGKKQFVLDESRRNTYNHSHPSVVGSESSVLNTFDGEVKQLLPVGLHTELGYARSLARFAANLGPVAWKVASKKIERALPPGMKFGPGWVGDDEAPPTRTSSLATASPCPLSQPQPMASTQLSSSITAEPCMVESNGDRLLQQEFANNSSLDGHPDKIIPSTIASSTVLSRSLEAMGEPVEASNRVSDNGLGLLSNISGGALPPIQIHQSLLIDPAMNGCSNGFGANSLSHMGKLIGPGWSAGSIGTDASVHSRMFDMVSKSNFINSTHAKTSELQSLPVVMRSQDCQVGNGIDIHAQPGRNGLLPQQKSDLINPDLNVRFQSPGSSNSSVRVDSPQPDLALQL